MAVEFKATSSRIEVASPPALMRKREMGFAAIALMLGGASFWYAKRQMPRSRVIKFGVGMSATCGLAAGFRPGAHWFLQNHAFYPLQGWVERAIEGRKFPRHPGWEGMEPLTIESTDGKKISARFLQGHEEGAHFGEAILYCPGNRTLYDQFSSDQYRSFLEDGYSLMLYHPPGYGDSEGPRTRSSDLLAADAVMQCLLGRPYHESQVVVMAVSIGTGAGSALAAKYSVAEVHLFVPFAELQDVTKRLVGRLGGYVQGIVGDRFGYDNHQQMEGAEARRLCIYEAGQDILMTDPNNPEAKKIQQVWDKRPDRQTCILITKPEGGHLDDEFRRPEDLYLQMKKGQTYLLMQDLEPVGE